MVNGWLKGEVAVIGKNRIMIYGPKNDGTYLVDFRTAKGEALAISVPQGETAVLKYFQERMPYGLYVPDDELDELGCSAWPDKGRQGGR
jgi:hypothetical protein